jgi:N6-L-threonylcarbamoyladenine synthase
VALIISGGHTMLLDVAAAGSYRTLGSTRDDAAGEAFDKVGKMLGLPYPGGPEVEQMAKTGDPTAYDFPRSMMKDKSLDFSFSGLKTAVLYTLTDRNPADGTPRDEDLPDLCASFQQAVIDILIHKALRAAQLCEHRTIALSGGVSLNRALRDNFADACCKAGIELLTADPKWCTDNAAMIGAAAWYRLRDHGPMGLDTGALPNLRLVTNETVS